MVKKSKDNLTLAKSYERVACIEGTQCLRLELRAIELNTPYILGYWAKKGTTKGLALPHFSHLRLRRLEHALLDMQITIPDFEEFRASVPSNLRLGKAYYHNGKNAKEARTIATYPESLERIYKTEGNLIITDLSQKVRVKLEDYLSQLEESNGQKKSGETTGKT